MIYILVTCLLYIGSLMLFFYYQLLEERQLVWDQREVGLERQLDTYEKRQNDILNTAQKVPCDVLYKHLFLIVCPLIFVSRM